MAQSAWAALGDVLGLLWYTLIELGKDKEMGEFTEQELLKIQSIAMDIFDEVGTEKLGECTLAILDLLAPDAASPGGPIPRDKAIAYGSHLVTIQNGLEQRLEYRDWFSE